MKTLIVYLMVGPYQTDRIVMGFPSLAVCGAVQGSLRVQYDRRKIETIFKHGGGKNFYYVGCS